MPDLTQDTVEYQILLEATKAVQDLEKLTVNASSADEKMRLAAVAVTDFGQRLGISLPVAEGLFKRVEASARELQITMAELQKAGTFLPPLGPLGQQLMNVNPVFPPTEAGATVSPEMWKGVHLQIQEINKEMVRFNELTRQTQVNLEAAAAAAAGIKVPIKTAADTMASLQAFAGGQRGQGILKNFLLGYQGTDDIQAKLRVLKTAIFDLAQGSGASFEQAGNLLRTSFNIPNVQVTTAIKELNNELGNTPPQAQKAVRSLDAIRIALGAIVAMIVFQLIQTFQQFFSTAIKNAYDLEGALYNVANAERIMSQRGIEIAPKDMKEMIDNLQRLVPIMSQIDATKAISSLSLFTKDLGYTKDQISSLSQAVGVLYVRNKAMGLSFEQVLSQVQTGLLTGRAQGIRDLGVSISEAAIKQEALRMGLVKSEEEFKNLTGDTETQIKAQAMLNIIVHSTTEEQKNLSQYLDSNAGKTDRLKASFSNLGTTVGQLILPGLGVLAQALTAVIDLYMSKIKNLESYVVVAASKIAAAWYVVQNVMNGHITTIGQMQAAYQQALPKMLEAAMGVFDGVEKINAMQDTATGSAERLTSALVDMSKVDLSSLGNSLQSIQDRMDDLTRDFNLKNQNYIEEQNVKMTRMQEDYQIEVQKVIQDANNKQKEANQKYRTQEEDAEAKYQERMRELREKYLLDLEDALRARDARQVLRLQAQYKMEKENLTRNYELDKKNRADQHAQEIAKIKSDEQQKLDEMAKAEALKESRAIEDFNREQALRQQQYDNEMSDLRRSWDERLTEEANKIAEEYGIDEKGAEAIKKLLQKYYGTGGVFDGLYSGSLNSLKIKGSAILAEMASIIAQFQSMTAASMMVGTFPGNEEYRGGGGTYNGSTPVTGGGGGGSSFSMNENVIGNRRAKGGIDFANRPTSVVFGEAGPELNISLPLGKSLGDVPNNLPASLQPQGINGLIRLALDLNPDLEVRIMENTLDKAAVMVTHTYRSRK